jgi:hypothetical protein
MAYGMKQWYSGRSAKPAKSLNSSSVNAQQVWMQVLAASQSKGGGGKKSKLKKAITEFAKTYFGGGG